MNIISYYPGSGGNRFYLNLVNDPAWQDKSINFDNFGTQHLNSLSYVQNVNTEFKYNVSLEKQVNEKFFMTHVMNYNQLKKMFPTSTIYKIYSEDYYLSLKRFSRIWNKDFEDIFNLLVWHDDFYKQTGIDKKADVLIDVNNCNSCFCKFIKNDFLIQNTKFDLIYNFFKNYGKNGLIMDFIKDNRLDS